MKLGGYTVKVSTGSMPQKVATGFDKVFEGWVGATYKPIAYLGSKVVNGINHAILAEQTLIVGEDVKSIVRIVLNEKPGDVDGTGLSIVEIKPLLSNGGKVGGVNVAASTEISDAAQAAFNKAFGGFLGSTVKPFAQLATQIVNGGKYYLAAELSMVVNQAQDRITLSANDTTSVAIIAVYDNYKEIEIDTIISGEGVKEGLLGAPLGEWP